MSTRLLLDYDGVLLRNNKLKQYQHIRSTKFLREVTGLSMKTCNNINKTYYPAHGHTVIMINKMFDESVTLRDYNDYVFDLNALSKLDGLVDDKTKTHMLGFQKVIKHCQLRRIPWSIFTNAHPNWVTYFSHALDFDLKCDILWTEDNVELLKPNPQSYQRIESIFVDSIFVFVDDSRKNVQACVDRPRWFPVEFGDFDVPSKIICALETII